MIKIVYAASWLAGRRFYSFSHTLYRGNEKWREPAVWRGCRVISPRCNGLLRYPHVFLMAMEDGEIVARVLTGAVGEKGYFALFDAVPDERAVGLLMNEMLAWQRRQNTRKIVGPVAPGEIDLGGGVLTEGFDEPAAADDVYNMPYYAELLEKCGLNVVEKRLVYRISLAELNREKYRKIAGWAKERFGYSLRHDLAAKPRELARAVCEVMEEDAEEEKMNRLIGAVCKELVPEMCPVVCVAGRPVGVLLTIGRDEERVRITMLWVRKAWRGKGAQAVLFDSAAKAMEQLGMTEADASWIDSQNMASRFSVESAGGRIVRQYRLYGQMFKEEFTKK